VTLNDLDAILAAILNRLQYHYNYYRYIIVYDSKLLLCKGTRPSSVTSVSKIAFYTIQVHIRGKLRT
jgi:hypothetical protein